MARRLRSLKRPYDAIGRIGTGRECGATDQNLGQCWRCHLAEVKLQEGETLENALRRFKRKVLQEDIIREVKRHAFYLKPGQKRRVKQALARKRDRKKARRETV
jgi:small subunit ribosomal protein S21